jgi:23S rRNA (uridine2552-2'-O)-methyltransferase
MHWRKKQTGDVYYQKAKEDGYRSRAIYKLIEIDDKYKLVKSNSLILDIGAAPGSWSQLVSKRLNSGNCVAVDIQRD